ncbi:hypothetical protein AKJ09_02370 [Labilithrix luteola]|uniref:Uncharacterized protein n=1 Tax=Labilithrix luteola TaxID=1391654 RepID=A0A0K1PQR5_9BACT|nr:hypothetical protein AKJ09_02370 [Labilithrix luteola]
MFVPPVHAANRASPRRGVSEDGVGEMTLVRMAHGERDFVEETRTLTVDVLLNG